MSGTPATGGIGGLPASPAVDTSTGGGGADLLYGDGTPDPGLGADGDSYIDQVDDSFYKKVAGSWVEILDAPHGALMEHFQSQGFAGLGGVLGTNVVEAGQQGLNQNLSPNGAASWSNAVVNPSSELSALIVIEVHVPALSISPPVDGTLFSYRRTTIMQFDGQQDVATSSGRNIQHDVTKGQFYIPKHIVRIKRGLAPGHNSSVVVYDDADFHWEDNGGVDDLPIYPQNNNAHGAYWGRIS